VGRSISSVSWKAPTSLFALILLAALPLAIAVAVLSTPPWAAAATDYVVVDTGQDTCYDDGAAITCPASGQAFYGQDAQYDGNQPSYTLSGDGLTVYDNNTGLTWTQSPDLNDDGDIDVDDKLTFAEAESYADTTLNPQSYGGYSDWRLPSMKELYSLMDFRGTDPSGPNPPELTPFIDTDYFAFAYGDESAGERLIDAQFWSSNAYVGTVFGNQSAAFGLNLADGRIKGYPTSGPVPKVNYVYFVRGNTGYGINDFTDNGDGTVMDNATGLMWSQDDSGDGVNTGPRSGMTWEDALAWVQEKNDANYLGYSDWRLPNAKEMQSIVDYSRAPDATGSAAIDTVFNITEITNEAGEVDYPWFWTGTTHVRSGGSAVGGVYICFGRATGYMNGSWLDVHGAGAQRSDQKDGDFTGYTYTPDGYYFAQAPQGDATRSYNYVRLVRDDTSAATPTPTLTSTPTPTPTSSSTPSPTATATATPTPDPDDLDGDGLLNEVETDTGVYVDPTDTGTDPLDPDTDGDLLLDGQEVLVYSTDPCVDDTDADGCTDGREVGDSETLGGQRDPLNEWDFFDVPLPVGEPGTGTRDKQIDGNDALGVLAKFGAVPGDPVATAPEYDAAYDRSAPTPDPWDTEAPDGVQDGNDVIWNLQSFGHSCVSP
jgi:hypothetical protein